MDVRFACVLAVAAAVVGGCSSTSDDSRATCEAVTIDRFKELTIVEESVLATPRSLNATAGPWSFRHAIENMTPPGADPGDFVRGWLSSWVGTKEVNGFSTDRPTEERDGQMRHLIVCPWL